MSNKISLMKPAGLVATIWCALTSVAFADESTLEGKQLVAPSYQLVFSDDFSTDPNSNGNWTVFRARNDPNKEGYWDPTQQVWYLTTHSYSLGTAAFANYDLTATSWKVDFKYLVDNGPQGRRRLCLHVLQRQKRLREPCASRGRPIHGIRNRKPRLFE